MPRTSLPISAQNSFVWPSLKAPACAIGQDAVYGGEHRMFQEDGTDSPLPLLAQGLARELQPYTYSPKGVTYTVPEHSSTSTLR